MENGQKKVNKINWKNILIGVIIGAILIGLGVVTYLLLQPKPTEPVSSITTKKATPAAKISTPPAKKDETVDWKTYTGETIPVSFKIPQNFSAKDRKGKIQNTYFEGLITVSDEKGEERFSVVNAATGAMMAFLYKEDIIAEGIKGTKNYYTNYKDPSNLNLGPENQTPKYTLISFSGKNFVINYAYNKDNEELVKKIIPTFKFLD